MLFETGPVGKRSVGERQLRSAATDQRLSRPR